MHFSMMIKLLATPEGAGKHLKIFSWLIAIDSLLSEKLLALYRSSSSAVDYFRRAFMDLC